MRVSRAIGTCVTLVLALAALLACSSKGSSFVNSNELESSGPLGSSTGSPQPSVPSFADDFKKKFEGKKMDLDFAGFVQGDCPAEDTKYMSKTFGGGWTMSVSPGTGSAVSVKLEPLPNSPFGSTLAGTIASTGVLDARGDSTTSFTHLVLQLPIVLTGPSTPLTGSADVKLHFVGQPAIGTKTGDCAGQYKVTGMVSSP
jgi:hypothetical protein